jgi:hypothetical protein
MKTYSATWFCIIASIASTTALAETKPSDKNDPPAQVSPLAEPSDVATILKIVTQMQGDVKSLQAAVANLAASQKDQTTQASEQLKDIARRLYVTCVLAQRQMEMTVPGGWSENILCTYQGLTAAGRAVTEDIFGKNPTNVDTAFGGP